MIVKERRRWSISIKLWLAMTMVILTVLGGLGLVITWQFSDFYLQQRLDSLRSDATEIAAQLGSTSNWNQRLALMAGYHLTTGTQMVLLDATGQPLAVSGNVAAVSSLGPLGGALGLIGPHISGWGRTAILTSFFTAEYFNDVMSGKVLSIKALPNNTGGTQGSGQAMLLAAAPVGKPASGVVLLGTSPQPVQESIATFRYLIWYTSLGAVLLATVVSLIVARHLTRPLALMNQAARRLAQGDFQPVEGIASKDEIGELAETLNIMGESLHNHVNWLSEEKTLLERILAGINDPVIMLDREGGLVYANAPAKALWEDQGQEQAERRQTILDFLRETILATAGQTAGEVPDEDQATGVGKKGAQILTLGTQILQVANAPITDATDNRGHVAVLHDVTASLRAEKERRDFLAGVTHELRTPLHLIQGYLEAIEDGVIPENEQLQHISLVLDEARRLARLVQELQDVNRWELAGEIRIGQINTGQLFSDLSQLFHARAQEAGIMLEITVDPDLQLAGDRDRLMQVFINLVENAFQHTPTGKRISVWTEETHDETKFAVQDEGEGISAEDIQKIFERFYRVDKARSRRDGGMGLGLAIVKQIIEGHGGRVWAESQFGHGSTFWIALPKSRHEVRSPRSEISVSGTIS